MQLYGAEGCDQNLGYDDLGNGPFSLPIAEFDFTIDCCIKNPTPPLIEQIIFPTHCDSSNGGFILLNETNPVNNLSIDDYEWIITDVDGEWVPHIDGDSGLIYAGLPAGVYKIEAITDEMSDDDVFEGCEMPTKTFRLGEDCE